KDAPDAPPEKEDQPGERHEEPEGAVVYVVRGSDGAAARGKDEGGLGGEAFSLAAEGGFGVSRAGDVSAGVVDAFAAGHFANLSGTAPYSAAGVVDAVAGGGVAYLTALAGGRRVAQVRDAFAVGAAFSQGAQDPGAA